ncbi:hypothetical protein [Chitinibacter tainanensis]|uniref:hypothetical protein n=1 Tax=Chitinibacter tainanensis TaxID=230667 RepID=UPI0012EB931E|nr:hypothetical protein [Chitinibacter tainanensis]
MFRLTNQALTLIGCNLLKIGLATRETRFVSLRHQQRGRTIPTHRKHVNTNPTKKRQQVDKRLICKEPNIKENRAKPRRAIKPQAQQYRSSSANIAKTQPKNTTAR